MTLGPDEEKELMALIYRQAKTWQGLKDVSEFVEFADRLRRLGCDVVVAGCTEVEACLARSGCETVDLIFPLRIVAESFTAQWMQSMR
jgi:aspartate/glutamate racemase